jgi:EpsD family peptidyl-prolyl cis-trans isomerase
LRAAVHFNRVVHLMKKATARQTGRIRLRPLTMATLALALSLSACHRKESASQTAAKVNKEEITVHQINYVLRSQPGLRPDQVDAASQQVLQRLINEELAVQKAEDLNLDRDPAVEEQLQAAKREILARAYMQRVAAAAPKPTADDARKFYDAHPALFKDRHVYDLHEILLQATPEQIAALRPKLNDSKTIGEFTDYLTAQGIKFADSEAIRSSDQLPPPAAESLAKMNAGDSAISAGPKGARVIYVSSVRSEPVSLEQAQGRIEQELMAQRQRELVAKDIKGLRAAAKIEYVGKYAEHAASAASGGEEATLPAEAPTPDVAASGT